MSDAPRGPRSRKVVSGTFAAVIRAYTTTSPKWTQPPPKGYADGTKSLWKRELDLVEHILGTRDVNEIRPSLIQAFLDELADRPGKAAMAYAALKQLEKWAIVRDLLPHHIMTGVSVDGPKGGHKPWPEEYVRLAEQHARPDLIKAITLAANTGQRGSDLVRMRETDIEKFRGRLGINVIQKKTGRQLWVPFTDNLTAAYTRWERRPGHLLLTPQNCPWTRPQLTEAWTWHRDHNSALAPICEAGLVLHGLRATACVRLYYLGMNSRQIADCVGMTEKTVQTYLRFSIQRENALAAVIHLEGRNHLKNKDTVNQELKTPPEISDG